MRAALLDAARADAEEAAASSSATVARVRPRLGCATGASMARATSILLIACPHACCVSWRRRPNAATDSGRSAGSFVNPSSTTSATAAGTPRGRRSGGASSGDASQQGRDRVFVGQPERWRAGEKLVQRRGQRVEVARGPRRLPSQQLGRRVHEGRGDLARRGLVRALHAGDAEVAEVRLTPRRQEDVLGLDVSMEHSLAVRALERTGELDPVVEHVDPRNPALDEKVVQRSAREVLHDDVGLTCRDPRVEDRDDVRMAREAAHRGALSLEAHRGGRVELPCEHLDRDLAVEADLASAVHRAVATPPDEHRVGDAVDAELDRSGRRGERRV